MLIGVPEGTGVATNTRPSPMPKSKEYNRGARASKDFQQKPTIKASIINMNQREPATLYEAVTQAFDLQQNELRPAKLKDFTKSSEKKSDDQQCGSDNGLLQRSSHLPHVSKQGTIRPFSPPRACQSPKVLVNKVAKDETIGARTSSNAMSVTHSTSFGLKPAAIRHNDSFFSKD